MEHFMTNAKNPQSVSVDRHQAIFLFQVFFWKCSVEDYDVRHQTSVKRKITLPKQANFMHNIIHKSFMGTLLDNVFLNKTSHAKERLILPIESTQSMFHSIEKRAVSFKSIRKDRQMTQDIHEFLFFKF